MDFMASWSGDDISLVDKPVDVAPTTIGGSMPLSTVGGQIKLEAILK